MHYNCNTIILLRRERRTPSCLVFWNFKIKKYRENNKCYVKYVFWKVFKNSIKLSTSPFLVILQTFFIWRALERKLGTQRALGHSGTQKAFGHLGTHALGYSDTRRALGPSGTQALEHLGTRDTQGTRGTLFSRLVWFWHELYYLNLFFHFLKVCVKYSRQVVCIL